MTLIIYLLIAFIIFFFQYKKHWKKLREINPGGELPALCYKEGWAVYIVPISWPISIPMYIIWQTLEFIYKKLNKNKEQ